MLIERVKNLLAVPAFYRWFQSLVGTDTYYRYFYSEFLKAPPNSRVLDIGCGAGAGLEYLPASIDYTGIDESPDYISAAQRRFGGRARFICGDIRILDPCSLGCFDFAIASGVLHHLDDDGVTALIEFARRVVNAGGALVTIDPCLEPARNNFLARWTMLHDRGRFVREFDEYRRLAEPHGEVEAFVRGGLIRVPTYRSVILRVGFRAK
jgi:SAM-dependent methyltransferase